MNHQKQVQTIKDILKTIYNGNDICVCDGSDLPRAAVPFMQEAQRALLFYYFVHAYMRFFIIDTVPYQLQTNLQNMFVLFAPHGI